jgi:hypothetical protein
VGVRTTLLTHVFFEGKVGDLKEGKRKLALKKLILKEQ